MTSSRDTKQSNSMLIRVLEGQLRSLAAADADKILLSQYAALITILKRHGLERIEECFSGKPPRSRDKHEANLFTNLDEMPLNNLLVVVNDEETPRRSLERIATDRFGVPSGSMRRYSNRKMLVEKLRSLISNEQAHETIGDLARKDSRSDR